LLWCVTQHGAGGRGAPQRGEMLSLPPKLFLKIMNDPPRRSNRLQHLSAAESIQRFRFEMLAQRKDRLLWQECVAVIFDRMIDLAKVVLLFGTNEEFRRRHTR